MASRRAAGPRPAATVATALVLAVAIARLLTAGLPPDRWVLELGLSAAAVVYVLAALGVLRRGWARRSFVVVANAVVPAILAGAMLSTARSQFGRLDVLAVLLFAVIAVSIPAGARLGARLAAAVAIDAVLAVTWLLWSGEGVAVLGMALVAITALQLLTAAQAAAGLGVHAEALSRRAHSSIAQQVGTAIDLPGVTRAVLENARAAYPLTSEAFLLLYDPAAERLRPLPLYLGPAGVVPLEADNLDFAVATREGLAGKVFAASRPMLWPTAFDVEIGQANLGEEARLQLLGLRRGLIRSAIGTPLIVDDEVIGVCVLLSRRQELAWSEADFTMVSVLAAEAACAIERARRYERELDQAHLDSITGLANHRQLTRTLDQEVARARRRDSSLGLLFCDLDRFKAVNDTYGHAAGDRVLTILARVLHESLRREDSAARYGGDEFVCVLPGADRHEADAVGRRVAEGFVSRIREDAELRTAGVTISCGVAIFPDDGDGVKSLLEHADSAMRVVKAGHRTSSVHAP